MGNGNMDVGDKHRKAGQQCGAMSEQRSDNGHVYPSPQKLLHLVGCRDPKMRPAVSQARRSEAPGSRINRPVFATE